MGVTAKKDSSKATAAKSAAKKAGATAAAVKTPKAATEKLKPKPASRAATPARKTAVVKTAPAAQPKAGKAAPKKATTSSAANVVVVKSLTVKKTVAATAGSGTGKGAGKTVGAASQKAPATAATPAAREVDSKATKSGQAGGSKASGGKAAKQDASAGLKDKIEKPVVLKVSEVATKTPKTTPDTQTLLTEEQILKMGEKDYMNEAQLAFFKARLQQLERDLLKNAGETTEHLRETVLVPDPADRATIEEEHALELRTRDRERKLLKKVQQSIVSIDGGEYGWCEETGEPIGIPRLLARPTATLSLEAQQRRELKQKLYGD
jgi:DnaK suppressor protein